MFKNLFIALAMLTSASSASASVMTWEPDVPANFTVDTINFSGYTLGLFDDEDVSYSTPLILDMFAEVSFAEAGSDWTATNLANSDNITLSGGNQFALAITDGFDWFEAVDAVQTSPGSSNYVVTFSNDASGVYAIDAIPTVVPVPAAVWLFGAGLLGLVGVARRGNV